MDNLSYVINYEWNAQTLLPCPNYYVKKDGDNVSYYDTDMEPLSKNDIDNVYLIKPISSIMVTNKDPKFKSIIRSEIHNEILNEMFIAENKSLDIRPDLQTVQTGGAKKNPKTIAEAKKVMDDAKKEYSVFEQKVFIILEELQKKKDELESGKNPKNRPHTPAQLETLKKFIESKENILEKKYDKSNELEDKIEKAEVLYNLFNSDLPVGWGEYNKLKLQLNKFYEKITIVDVAFSTKFMSSNVSILYNKINKFLPQPYNPFNIMEDNIIGAFMELLELDNADINKQIYKYDKSCFEKGNNEIPRIKDVISEYIRGGDNKLVQTAYLFGKRIFCLNKYCYRFAVDGASSATIKQRQECQKCTTARTTDSVNTDGYDIKIKFSKQDGLYHVTMGHHDVVEILSRKYCKNNHFKEKGIGYLTQSITYFDPETKKEVPMMIKRRKDNLSVEDQEAFMKRMNNPDFEEKYFYCPISHFDYAQLPSDIFETDHINGNHFDNTKGNLQRLCKLCHAYKTFLSSDKGHLGLASMFNIVFGRIRDDDKEYEKYILLKMDAYNDLIKDVKKDLTNIITVKKL
jgi:hypothetical protein